ncbi:hypothetical protein Tco_0915346 [Tanacetum coccineum]
MPVGSFYWKAVRRTAREVRGRSGRSRSKRHLVKETANKQGVESKRKESWERSSVHAVNTGFLSGLLTLRSLVDTHMVVALRDRGAPLDRSVKRKETERSGGVRGVWGCDRKFSECSGWVGSISLVRELSANPVLETTSVVQTMEQQMTLLCDIDPMMDDVKVLARCISIWKSHAAGKPNQPWGLDVVLQDPEV